MGLEAEDLLAASETLSAADVEPFRYPHDKEIEAVGVRGIYLNNYLRWDTKAQHEEMLERYDYETAAQQRTFDTYSDVDCIHYSGAHDWIKYAKWGYGKATDHACREIRLRRMTRSEGEAMARRYEGIRPRDLPRLLEFMKMTQEEFDEAVDRFRDPQVWRRESGGFVRRADAVDRTTGDRAALGKREECHFIETAAKAEEPARDGYTLLHRGWVDRPRRGTETASTNGGVS